MCQRTRALVSREIIRKMFGYAEGGDEPNVVGLVIITVYKHDEMTNPYQNEYSCC